MSERVWTLGATVLVAALAAGCGAAESTPRQGAPRLPSNVASELATQSDALAASLEQGDGCSAVRLADELRRSARRAISARQIPRAFRGELLRTVDALSAEVTACAPSSDEEQGDAADGDRGKHKGKVKGKGKGGGKD